MVGGEEGRCGLFIVAGGKLFWGVCFAWVAWSRADSYRFCSGFECLRPSPFLLLLSRAGLLVRTFKMHSRLPLPTPPSASVRARLLTIVSALVVFVVGSGCHSRFSGAK